MSIQRPTTTEEWEAWCKAQVTLLIQANPAIGWEVWLQLKLDDWCRKWLPPFGRWRDRRFLAKRGFSV